LRTLARAALRDDVYSQQAALTAEILRSVPDEELPALDHINAWVERTLQILTDINSSGTFDLSTLSVALREIRNFTTSSGASPAEMEVSTR
jgi:glutamate dehydrogenase